MIRIKSVERVCEMAKEKKSISLIRNLHKPFPAAFLQNWPAVQLYNSIKKGELFEYEKTEAS